MRPRDPSLAAARPVLAAERTLLLTLTLTLTLTLFAVAFAVGWLLPRRVREMH
jgi:hypothetical protein